MPSLADRVGGSNPPKPQVPDRIGLPLADVHSCPIVNQKVLSSAETLILLYDTYDASHTMRR
jgi:hypothetical protein